MNKQLLECIQTDNRKYQLTVTVSPEDFSVALEAAYQLCKPQLEIEGVEKGQVTREQAEEKLGQEFFYPQAAQQCCAQALEEIAKEEQLDTVGYPEITACSTGPEGLKFTALLDRYPEVKLGNYKKIRVHIPEPQVEDSEVDLLIEEYARRAGKESVVYRPAQNGDSVRLDLEATLESGKPVPGGHAEDYVLVLGSKTFLPALEEGIVGMRAGEKRDVPVTFPKEYAAELAGQNATFHVTAKTVFVMEAPEVNEAFAQEYFECDMATLRAGVKESILQDKMDRHRVQVEEQVLSQAAGQMDCMLPESMIQKEMDTLTLDFCERLESQGSTLEQYLEQMKMSEADYDQTARASAVHRLRLDILLKEVAKAENIVLDEETLARTAAFLAEQYGATEEAVKEALTPAMLEREALRQAVVDLILGK
ncbi:MAG: trigger factor [Clostridia bacterium]|nr:trigger factor [Clostridia bacterium]